MMSFWILGGWIVIASLITAAMYYLDKRSAAAQRRRISENTLLTWSALGGWPGAVLMGRTIRHKTQKLSYRIWFALAVVANLIAIFGLYWVLN